MALLAFKCFPIRPTTVKHLTIGGISITIGDDIPAKPLPGNR